MLDVWYRMLELSGGGTVFRRNSFSVVLLGGMFCLASINAMANAASVVSPNGSLTLALEVAEIGDAVGAPIYSIRRDGRVVVAPSRFGLILEDSELDSGASFPSTWRSCLLRRPAVTRPGARFTESVPVYATITTKSRSDCDRHDRLSWNW